MTTDEKQRKLCSDLLFALEKVENRPSRVHMLMAIGRQFFIEGAKWAIGTGFAFGLTLGAVIGAWVAR